MKRLDKINEIASLLNLYKIKFNMENEEIETDEEQLIHTDALLAIVEKCNKIGLGCSLLRKGRLYIF